MNIQVHYMETSDGSVVSSMHSTVSLIFDCKLKSDLLNYVYPFRPIVRQKA